MNLQDYIERMKMWIDKQHFIMRHYKFALGIFFIITVALLGIGIFYPHEEENVHISLDQSMVEMLIKLNEAQKNYQKKQHMIIEMGKERTILKMKVI